MGFLTGAAVKLAPLFPNMGKVPKAFWVRIALKPKFFLFFPFFNCEGRHYFTVSYVKNRVYMQQPATSWKKLNNLPVSAINAMCITCKVYNNLIRGRQTQRKGQSHRSRR